MSALTETAYRVPAVPLVVFQTTSTPADEGDAADKLAYGPLVEVPLSTTKGGLETSPELLNQEYDKSCALAVVGAIRNVAFGATGRFTTPGMTARGLPRHAEAAKLIPASMRYG